MQQMSINYDVVASAVNQISAEVESVKTRTDKFFSLVQEKSQATGNKFTLLATLRDKLADETQNIKKIIEAEEEIKSSLSRYAEQAAEVDSDAELL